MYSKLLIICRIGCNGNSRQPISADNAQNIQISEVQATVRHHDVCVNPQLVGDSAAHSASCEVSTIEQTSGWSIDLDVTKTFAPALSPCISNTSAADVIELRL